jgi:MoxR-like ATPase
MTVAEAPPRAARKRPAKVKVAPEDFLRVAQFLNTKVLVERPVEIRVMNLALIAGINAHLNGSPGVAKSLGLDEYAKCIVGATYFKKPLNEDLSPSRVLGEWDYPRFMRGDTSELERKIAGYAPTADIIFVDEVFRANGLMLDALLPLANVGEREFEHNGGMAKAPVKLMVSAANFNPDPDNVRAQAYLDRVTVMLWVERVKASDSFKEILRRAQARRTAHGRRHVGRRTRNHHDRTGRAGATRGRCGAAHDRVPRRDVGAARGRGARGPAGVRSALGRARPVRARERLARRA